MKVLLSFSQGEKSNCSFRLERLLLPYFTKWGSMCYKSTKNPLLTSICLLSAFYSKSFFLFQVIWALFSLKPTNSKEPILRQLYNAVFTELGQFDKYTKLKQNSKPCCSQGHEYSLKGFFQSCDKNMKQESLKKKKKKGKSEEWKVNFDHDIYMHILLNVIFNIG